MSKVGSHTSVMCQKSICCAQSVGYGSSFFNSRLHWRWGTGNLVCLVNEGLVDVGDDTTTSNCGLQTDEHGSDFRQ